MTAKPTPLTNHPTGVALLRDPALNRSTAFTEAEREKFGLVGLLPDRVEDEEVRLQRVLVQLDYKPTDLERYIFLSSLRDNDETLYFKALMSDPARFLPLVYTPTVGEACQKFDQILRRPAGVYLSITRKGQLRDLLRNWPHKDVRFIVVTDGERILGLGDLGINGMGIPIGKLALYTACAGVPPKVTLPITLDVGTNNEQLIKHPLYLGLRQPRITGAEYDDFIDEFIMAVQDVFPRACIQFEDFALPHAAPILARYRDKVCCFNDDIQGTAAVALAGLIAASKIVGGSLTDQRFLFLGAGTAATGIAALLAKALEQDGLSPADARRRCWLFDLGGLIQSKRGGLTPFQQPFAHEHAPLDSFTAVIEALKPTAIIGVSGVGKAFDRTVIETMARLNKRPIIFPYSNPTSHSECTAEEAYRWTDGRAVFASGSPFQPVYLGDKTFLPSQGNNVYIFPAVGMAIYATEAARVTDEMFIVAARALAEQVTPAQIATGLIYPPQSMILDVSLNVARAVARYIFDHGLAGVPAPADLAVYMAEKVYRPAYRPLV
jgi:malate dehydrogenase (oxaloacetate-decarboxylating)(NADP+)